MRCWLVIAHWSLVVALAACDAERAPMAVTACGDLPPRDCGAACDELVWFTPAAGPGYQDVPLDDEVDARDSTSYLRRDLMMAVKYATAKVACVAAAWPGSQAPLALGDMSDRDGAVPGTARGRPRHPRGTHGDGRDIDLAYYQAGTPDNHLRAICRHTIDGVDQRHCVGAPTHLDAARTALLIGALFESPYVRIVGMDGAAEPPIRAELRRLCAARVIDAAACARVRLGFETADTGRGWFHAHHNHLHVSWRPLAALD
jgi:hypothetical protein